MKSENISGLILFGVIVTFLFFLKPILNFSPIIWKKVRGISLDLLGLAVLVVAFLFTFLGYFIQCLWAKMNGKSEPSLSELFSGFKKT